MDRPGEIKDVLDEIITLHKKYSKTMSNLSSADCQKFANSLEQNAIKPLTRPLNEVPSDTKSKLGHCGITKEQKTKLYEQTNLMYLLNKRKDCPIAKIMDNL